MNIFDASSDDNKVITPYSITNTVDITPNLDPDSTSTPSLIMEGKNRIVNVY